MSAMTTRQVLERLIENDSRNVAFIQERCRDMRTIEHVIANCANRYLRALDLDYEDLTAQALINLQSADFVGRRMGVLR